MATIYRFIVEQKQTIASGRKNSSDSGMSLKSAAKKGKYISILSGAKGGVEHNRKMRAINPLINKITGGAWEKGMRVGRAGLGLVKINQETGKVGLSGPAIAIIIAFVIQALLKWQQSQRQLADKLNAQNYKQLENGIGAIHGDYKVSTAFWTGRHTYNQNK